MKNRFLQASIFIMLFLLLACKPQEKYKPDPQKVAQGEQLFIVKGCVSCHPLTNSQAKFKGPGLLNIQNKVQANWLVKWLEEPRHYLTDSNMPSYFPNNQEFLAQGFSKNISKPHLKDSINRQSIAMATYLLEQQSTQSAQNKSSPSDKDIMAGKRLYNENNCMGCHRIGNSGDFNAPALDKIGSKVNESWLFNWLKNPQKYDPGTIMPPYSHLSDQEIWQLVAYLMSLQPSNKTDLKLIANTEILAKGKSLIQQYGCYSCHTIKGFDNQTKPIGTNLKTLSRPLNKFSFGHLNIEKTRRHWIYNKIMRPQIFNSDKNILMPQYNLSVEEGEALTDFILDYSSQQQ